MDEMMAMHMPDSMRTAGLAMHTAASNFATVAATRDPKAALASLALVTQRCVSCHASYRLR